MGAKFKAFRAAFTETIDTRMRFFGQAITDRAKSRYLSGRPGLNSPTGRLRSSINWQVSGQGDSRELRVGTNVIYGRIHEYGGTIVPKRARLLSFVIGGKRIFAKQVTIPRRPYLQPSVDEETPIFARALQTTLRDVVTNGMRQVNP